MYFYVRVDVNHDFVALKLKQGEITPLGDLKYRIQKMIDSFLLSNQDTLTVFIAKAKSIAQIREKIMKAWQEMYPDNMNAIEIFAYPKEDTAQSNVMRDIFTGYFAWTPYISLCTELAHTIPDIKSHYALATLRAQSYLVFIDSGYGFSTMVSSLGDFFNKFEIYDDPDTVIHEYPIIDNDDESKLKGAFTATEVVDFLGEDDKKDQSIGIDISYFLTPEKHASLRDFLRRLQKYTNKYTYLFRVPYLDEKRRKEVFDLINDIIPVREIDIAPNSELCDLEAVISGISKNCLEADDEVCDLIVERIRCEKKDGRYYGFKTVSKIATELSLLKFKSNAIKKLSGENYAETLITPGDIPTFLDGFKADSKSGYDELHELIGMEKIEERIREIVAQVKVAKSNKSIDNPCLHMRFTGAPGTGKTTVARIVGKIFKEEGILSKGSFFEYAARSLCGQYVGQTAPRTLRICQDAYGSVLFLDEAYSLYAGENNTSSNDFGKEAITTLIAEMENNRNDMVVIMAGYTEDMDKLMEANAGLRSRMPFVIDFKSYSMQELTDIFMSYVRKHFYYEEGFEAVVSDYFNNLSKEYIDSKEFANARFVRNLYERTWSKAASRCARLGDTNIILTKADFDSASAEKEFSEKLKVDKRIGF